MTPSPLQFHYRWNAQASALEAAHVDYPDDWSVLYVPGLHLMFATPGEVECAVAAGDAALDAREREE